MARRPRTQKPHIQRPSPLQQVQLTRPLSTIPSEKASMDEIALSVSASEKACLEETRTASPTGGLVRDPLFWKRFSTAVHMSEVDLGREENGAGIRTWTDGMNSGLEEDGNGWLAQQAREKRQCRRICVGITLVVMLLVIAAAVVGYYFTKIKKI